MSLQSVVLDSQNEKIYFHHKHVTVSLPIKTGFDCKWYIVTKCEEDLDEFVTANIVGQCDIHCFDGFNNAIYTHNLINVIKNNNDVMYSEI